VSASDAYERLMAEAVPTGTFGHARPARQQQTESAPRWTPEEQARHRAELEAALNAIEKRGTRRPPQAPHLRVINGGSATDAA
jgi:hypothetical protein